MYYGMDMHMYDMMPINVLWYGYAYVCMMPH